MGKPVMMRPGELTLGHADFQSNEPISHVHSAEPPPYEAPKEVLLKMVEWGGGHHTLCDGVIHLSRVWTPVHIPGLSVSGGNWSLGVDCACFCNDPEFKAKGFSIELQRRYQVIKHVTEPNSPGCPGDTTDWTGDPRYRR